MLHLFNNDAVAFTLSTVTTLFDVRTHRVVWAGTTETFNPSTVRQETPGFADLILAQLAARGLIAAPKP